MDQTAVGTITFRWGQRILAFGHPMFGMGAVSLPMASAYVHEIFPSYQRSFKLASPVRVEGALQQDTQTAIGGTIGMTADTIPMTVALRDPARTIARKYRVRVMKDPVITPQLIGLVATEAIETTLGMTSDKMVRVDMRLNIDGAPPIVRRNYLYANGFVTTAALVDLSQTLDITQSNEFARGSIRSVELSIAVEAERKTAAVKRLAANRNKVKAGESIQVTVGLEPSHTPGKVLPYSFNFTVPADTPTGSLRIAAGASADFWPMQVRVGGAPPQPTNLRELIAAWNKVGSFNELLVQVSTTQTFLQVDQQKITDPAPSWSKLMRGVRSTNIGSYNEVESRRVTTPFSLFGAQFLTVPIESIKHPDKGGTSAVAPVPDKDDATPDPAAKPTPGAPIPDDTGDGDPGDPGDPGSIFRGSTFQDTASSAWMSVKSSFLQQLKAWRRLKAQGTDAVLPSREKPDPPITPAITSATPSPTAVGTPTPAPSPSPVPSPTPDSKSLARPALSWVQEGAAEFLKGNFDGSFVTSEGQVHMAPTAKQIATTDQPFVWSIAADTRGNTYLGTGNDARILRIDGNGRQSVFYDGPEVAVTALTTDAEGNLYAAVTPGGKIYRFTPDGARRLIFDSGQTFVWALEFANISGAGMSPSLLAATGGARGKLYKVMSAYAPFSPADVQEIAHVPQKHIRAISVRDSDIFVGTGNEGVLYHIDGKTSEATALFQTGEGGGRKVIESEILAVAAAPEGVYFGTSSSGTLYRWDERGGVVELYPSPQQAIYALRRTADGKLYAATGDQGVVYQIQPGANANTTRAARLVEPTQLQSLALSLAPSGDLLIGTGNNGAAYRVGLQSTPAGTFTSNVFDAKNVVLWGALRVLGRGTLVETRSGNTVDPDASWSGWKPAVINDLGEQQVASPPARYLQYRVRLDNAPTGAATTGAVPEAQLSRIEVVYRTRNNAPSVALDAPRGGEFWNGKEKLKWISKDADNDPLRHRVWFSADEGRAWQPLEVEDAMGTSFELDTSKWKDGVYRVKVEASDAAGNPEDPQSAEAISQSFAVDNTAPRLEANSSAPAMGTDAGASRLQVTAIDGLSPITAAEWRLVRSAPLVKSTPAPAAP
ncbi:MAG TPA: hypothetical protein VNA16_07815, partial [Abditibacteriaceae bacterium]|nr:hypothetical protein [Abditibacteriaceae bacterium]